MTRTTKTPRQRAEEALGVAQRRVAKAERKLRAAEAAVTVAQRELATANRRLTYAEQDPDLPQTDEGVVPSPEEEVEES